MMNKILLKIAKSILTKDRLKELAGMLLDEAAEQIVEATDDDIGEISFDQAVILLKDRIKVVIEES